MPIRTTTLGPGTLTLGTDGDITSIASQVRAATLTPSVETADDLHVLSGETKPGARTETWSLSVTLLQDAGGADSVQDFLFNHRGTIMPFHFVPTNSGNREFTGNLVVEAVAFGGEIGGEDLTAEAEWSLVGQPTMTNRNGQQGHGSVGPAGFNVLTGDA